MSPRPAAPSTASVSAWRSRRRRSGRRDRADARMRRRRGRAGRRPRRRARRHRCRPELRHRAPAARRARRSAAPAAGLVEVAPRTAPNVDGRHPAASAGSMSLSTRSPTYAIACGATPHSETIRSKNAGAASRRPSGRRSRRSRRASRSRSSASVSVLPTAPTPARAAEARADTAGVGIGRPPPSSDGGLSTPRSSQARRWCSPRAARPPSDGHQREAGNPGGVRGALPQAALVDRVSPTSNTTAFKATRRQAPGRPSSSPSAAAGRPRPT